MIKFMTAMVVLWMLPSTSIYDFKVPSLDGNTIDLAKYKGKNILIVNTASQCGYTKQYAELEQLYEKYKGNLVIVGFPANNFGQQEPGTNAEIKGFCLTKYSVSFPLFSKISVKGSDKHPLYQYLEREKRGFLGTKNIKWNFTKFLVGRDGQVLGRFAPTSTPEQLDGVIAKVL